MKLTKLGHSCVRLERDGRTLVVDPGGFSEQDAAVGADAILITHEHPDHLNEDRLRAATEAKPDLEIWTNRAVAERLDGLGVPVHAVGEGDAFAAAGFDVQVHGELHGVVHPDLPVVPNVGFLVRGGGASVFHPGDAFTVPPAPVDALLVPIHAPWLTVADAVGYMREVRPGQAFAQHEGMLNERGLAVLDALLLGGQLELGTAFRRLGSGDAVELPER
jgi:L-ascorbate metabolism protein UlaG (beta-lactamase superfamily)